MGGDGWIGICVRMRAQNSSNQYAVAVKNGRNYHRIFTSKAVAGVFAVFATGKYLYCRVYYLRLYTVASVSVEREHVEWRRV